ncbi:MAG: MMPL family transporter [Litorimonas sp.]
MAKATQNTSFHIRLEAGFNLWLRFAQKYRFFILATWVIAAIIAGVIAAGNLSINTDTSEMIDAKTPYRQDQIAYQAIFPQTSDEILVLIRADSPDAADFFTDKLTQSLSQSKHIKSIFNPELDPFFQKNGLLFLSTEELETTLAQLTEAAPLIERLTLTPTLPSLFDALAQAATQENDTAQTMFNAVSDTLEANLNGQRKALSWRSAFVEGLEPPFQRILTLDPVLDTTRLRPAATVQEAIEQSIEALRIETGLNPEVFVTGNPVLRSDELQSVSRGIGFAFFISFILVGLLLLWALRSLTLAFFTLISLVISIVITAGIAACIFTALNLVSIAFTVLMVGLGVDFAIHLLLHVRQESGLGKSPSAAFYRTTRQIGTALVLTAPSTALAFLAFVPTQFVGMSQLGIIAAIGVVVAFLVATSFLPAIYSALPPPKNISPKASSITPHMQKKGFIADGLRPKVAIFVIVIAVLGTVLLPNARFDADPMALRSRTAPSVIAFNQLFDRAETTPFRLNYLSANEDDTRLAAEAFKQLGSVKSARTIWSFIPEDQSDKLELIDYAVIGLEFAVSGEGQGYPIEPDPTGRLKEALQGRSDAASIRLFEVLSRWDVPSKTDSELMRRSQEDTLFYWPHELERLRNQIQASEVTRSSIPDNIASRYTSANGRARVEIIPNKDLRNETNRRAFISDVKSAASTLSTQSSNASSVNISGSARTIQEAGDIIQRAMLKAIIAALIMVSILLYIVVREFKLVIIMLVPLLLAGILTTATGVIFGLPYNFANVIVLPLLIGIGVDSSLHLALQSRKSDALKSVFDTVTPRAVLFSGFTTIASFGSLTFSDHRGTSSMGALLMIAITWVIICTIFVTPSLMKWFGRPKSAQI